MNQIFKSYHNFMLACALIVSSFCTLSSQISTPFSEGFDDITTLAGNDWTLVNNSEPLGVTN